MIVELNQVDWRRLRADLLGMSGEPEAEHVSALRRRLRLLNVDDEPEA
jgi:hypothetical protein